MPSGMLNRPVTRPPTTSWTAGGTNLKRRCAWAGSGWCVVSVVIVRAPFHLLSGAGLGILHLAWCALHSRWLRRNAKLLTEFEDRLIDVAEMHDGAGANERM